MSLLRGLRLNCFLAALLPSLLAGSMLVYQQYTQHQKILDTYTQASEDSIAYCAQLIEHGKIDSAHISTDIRDLDPRWQYVAIVIIDEHSQIQVLAPLHDTRPSSYLRAGDDPHRALVNSLHHANHWKLGSQTSAVACPLTLTEAQTENTQQTMCILYGEINTRRHFDMLTLLYTGLGSIIFACALAIYLSRRIYRPIAALCEETDAALQGKHTLTGYTHTSAETAHIRSSINDLVHLYRDQNKQIASQSDTITILQSHISSSDNMRARLASSDSDT